MVEYLFLDKTTKPTDEYLKEVLSNTYKYWMEIKDEISTKYGRIIPEWKFNDKKTGWTMKNMLKKRNLFFFKPYKSYFNPPSRPASADEKVGCNSPLLVAEQGSVRLGELPRGSYH